MATFSKWCFPGLAPSDLLVLCTVDSWSSISYLSPRLQWGKSSQPRAITKYAESRFILTHRSIIYSCQQPSLFSIPAPITLPLSTSFRKIITQQLDSKTKGKMVDVDNLMFKFIQHLSPCALYDKCKWCAKVYRWRSCRVWLQWKGTTSGQIHQRLYQRA